LTSAGLAASCCGKSAARPLVPRRGRASRHHVPYYRPDRVGQLPSLTRCAASGFASSVVRHDPIHSIDPLPSRRGPGLHDRRMFPAVGLQPLEARSGPPRRYLASRLTIRRARSSDGRRTFDLVRIVWLADRPRPSPPSHLASICGGARGSAPAASAASKYVHPPPAEGEHCALSALNRPRGRSARRGRQTLECRRGPRRHRCRRRPGRGRRSGKERSPCASSWERREVIAPRGGSTAASPRDRAAALDESFAWRATLGAVPRSMKRRIFLFFSSVLTPSASLSGLGAAILAVAAQRALLHVHVAEPTCASSCAAAEATPLRARASARRAR